MAREYWGLARVRNIACLLGKCGFHQWTCISLTLMVWCVVQFSMTEIHSNSSPCACTCTDPPPRPRVASLKTNSSGASDGLRDNAGNVSEKEQSVFIDILQDRGRPLLVRFKSYIGADGGPIHIGYGGITGRAILEPFGFRETESDDWDLLWSLIPQWDYLPKMETDFPRSWQVQNHCFRLRNVQGISGSKISQWQHFQCMRDRFGAKEFNFVPESYIFPEEKEELVKIIEEGSLWWIAKPSMGKRGIGVKLVQTPHDLPRDGEYLVQKYIHNPLLLHGRKFHIRLYLLVLNLHPLQLLVHREGLVLLASSNYTASRRSVRDMSVHLTNAAIADRSGKQSVSNSMLLSDLWSFMKDQGTNTTAVWNKITDALVKLTLGQQCFQPFESRELGSCFDLMGVDVILDEDLMPHVLENNNGPELYTVDVESRQANDRAHKAMLNDLIPLAALPKQTTHQDRRKFMEKLKTFQSQQRIPLCKQFAGFGGSCISSDDIRALWKHFIEEDFLGNFQVLYPSQDIEMYKKYLNYPLTWTEKLFILWVTKLSF